MDRVGLLGGTFNPVHAGHVRLGLEMAEALRLDGVEYIPAARPPHKPGEGMLPFGLRTRLLELALEGIEGFTANLCEAERPGPSYTWDTLTLLKRERPGAQFHFIMGASDLLNLHLWKRGLELGELASLAVANRGRLGREETAAYIEAHPEMRCEAAGSGTWRFPSGNRLELVDVPRLDISASFIRDRFRRGASLRCLVPRAVEDELGRLRDEVLKIWG